MERHGELLVDRFARSSGGAITQLPCARTGHIDHVLPVSARLDQKLIGCEIGPTNVALHLV